MSPGAQDQTLAVLRRYCTAETKRGSAVERKTGATAAVGGEGRSSSADCRTGRSGENALIAPVQ